MRANWRTIVSGLAAVGLAVGWGSEALRDEAGPSSGRLAGVRALRGPFADLAGDESDCEPIGGEGLHRPCPPRVEVAVRALGGPFGDLAGDEGDCEPIGGEGLHRPCPPRVEVTAVGEKPHRSSPHEAQRSSGTGHPPGAPASPPTQLAMRAPAWSSALDVATAALSAPIVPAFEIVDGRRVEVASGELLVEPRSPSDESVLIALLRADLGAEPIGRVGRSGTLRVALPRGVSVADALERARRHPEVAAATPNAIVRGAGADEKGKKGEKHKGDAGKGGDGEGAKGNKKPAKEKPPWNVAAVDAPLDPIDGDVTIAVLDSGLAFRDHVDAEGIARPRAPWLDGVALLPGADVLHGDAYPDDRNNHGTHVASLLVGPFGLARGAALLPIQVLGDDLVGTEAALVAGLDYAVEAGADVVNMSLVFGAGYYPSPMLDRAVRRALAHGVVLVAAAGNDGAPAVRFPAAFPGVIAAGASAPAGKGTFDLARAAYSSHGAELDLLAPGGDLDADANGDGVPDGVAGVTFDPEAPAEFAAWLFAGTSQAAAHVSAAAARLVAAGEAPRDVGAILRRAARPIEGKGFDVLEGAGALDVKKALASEKPLPPEPGVVLTASFEKAEKAGSARSMRAGVRVVDSAGKPLAKHVVHARFRGAQSGAASCTTDAKGACFLASGALAWPMAAVSLEVAVVVDPKGRATPPRDLFLKQEEVEPVLAALEGSDGAVVIWKNEAGPEPTWILRGLALDTALPPTIVALDEEALASLTGGANGAVGTSGTGFGSSSFDWFVLKLAPVWLASGTGFGSSSLDAKFFVYSYHDFHQAGPWWAASPALGGAYDALAAARFVPGEIVGAVGAAQTASQGGATGAIQSAAEASMKQP